MFSRKKSQLKLFWQAAGLTGLVLVTLVVVSRFDQLRYFYSQANGEPADIYIDTQAVLGPMPRPWRYLAQGGEGHDWRMGALIPPVKSLQPEYIRLDHIYDFYDVVQGSPGQITFDFSKLDLVVSDIIASGATPYLVLSYMPPAISAGDIVDKPVYWQDWELVVQNTIEHYSGDLGLVDVYYEVWNEPDLFGGWKYYGEKNYLDLYHHAVNGADRAQNVKRFKIGGPATTALYKNWFDAMAKYVLENDLRMDFFSWHRYHLDIEQFQQDMIEVQQWVQAYPQLEPTLEMHISEWGHESDNHRGYDSGFSAAHTVAGSIEMIPAVGKAFIFEIQDGKDPQGQPLWGRWGMFTHQDVGGQPKPRYQALRLLDSIGDQRLQLTGKGTWVKGLAAKNEAEETEVVLVNYDALGRHSENVPITFVKIEPGQYLLEVEYLAGRRHQQQLATDAAVLRTEVFLPVNEVAKAVLKYQGAN